MNNVLPAGMEQKSVLHLFVFVHGNHGKPGDWAIFCEHMKKLLVAHEVDYLFLTSAVNAGLKTHDGLNVLGNRLCEEFFEFLQSHSANVSDKEIHLSIVSHSLGNFLVVLPFRWSDCEKYDW